MSSCFNCSIAGRDAFANAIAQQDRAGQIAFLGDQYGGRAQTVGGFEQRVRTFDSVLGQKRRASGSDGASFEHAFGAAAGKNVAVLDALKLHAAPRGFGGDHAREHVVRSAFRRGRQANNSGFCSSERDHAQDFELPAGDGAGFVEHHRVDFGGLLKHGAAAHQNSAPRQAADR